METVILCGGKGTRLGPSGERDPKPLLEIGGSPILWHIMKIYAAQDHDRFILCLGHLADRFREFAESLCEPWRVTLADTGLDTPTGGRVKRVEPQIEGDDFLVTYGDGVADVDIRRLIEFHRDHGRIATVTSVRPRTPFGVMHVDSNNRVVTFDEKPLMKERVNGGFFVFRRDVFRYLADDSILEPRVIAC